jgi:hypothetical protein
MVAKTSISERCLQGEPLRAEDLRRIMRIILDGIRSRPDSRMEEGK